MELHVLGEPERPEDEKRENIVHETGIEGEENLKRVCVCWYQGRLIRHTQADNKECHRKRKNAIGKRLQPALREMGFIAPLIFLSHNSLLRTGKRSDLCAWDFLNSGGAGSP